jgi:hypothetical protein
VVTAATISVQQEIDLPGAMLTRVPVVRVTREALLAESEDFLGRTHAHFETFHGQEKRTPLVEAALDAYEGLVTSGVCAYVIAAMLRQVDEADPALAQKLAGMVDLARESGLDWLQEANDDLRPRDGEAQATR